MRKLPKFCILCIVLFTSCLSDSSSVSEYMEYISKKENGFTVSQSYAPYLVEVAYKPTELMVLNRLRKSDVSKKEFKSLKPKFENMMYFDVRIGVEHNPNINLNTYGVSSFGEVSERLNYLSYDFENDVKLLVNGVEIEPLMFHFERSFGVSPFKSFLFAFPKPEFIDNQKIIINSPVLNIENMVVEFDSQLLHNAPKLNIS